MLAMCLQCYSDVRSMLVMLAMYVQRRQHVMYWRCASVQAGSLNTRVVSGATRCRNVKSYSSRTSVTTTNTHVPFLDHTAYRPMQVRCMCFHLFVCCRCLIRWIMTTRTWLTGMTCSAVYSNWESTFPCAKYQPFSRYR